MTDPKIATIHRGGSRYYVHPDTGVKIPGVTSILNMLPKSFLKFWASKVVAEYAIDHLGDMVNIVLRGDKQGAIDYLKNAPNRDTKDAAELGSAAHEAFEIILKGKPIGRVRPDVEIFVRLFEKFVEDVQPKILMQEETVYSEDHSYMGSFDGYGSIADKLAWFDWKTTRSGIHAEVALQLAAYRYSQYVIQPDGTTKPTPPADGGLVLHVRPEKLQLVEVKCDEDVFAHFLHLRETFRWVDGMDREVIGKSAYAITPDDLPASNVARKARGRRA